MSKPTHLYRHFNSAGMLLYVGVSLNYLVRTSQHASTAEWYEEVVNITIEAFQNREAALKAEKKAIKNENPKYNQHHMESLENDTYVYIRLPAEIKRQIEERAAADGSNMTIWVRQLIMKALSNV